MFSRFFVSFFLLILNSCLIQLLAQTQTQNQVSPKCVQNCVQSHRLDGADYVWLWPQYGKVLRIDYEEPVQNQFLTSSGKSTYSSTGEMIGNWKTYDLQTWFTHCNVINHYPGNLQNAHIQAFINPKTRFARLRFTFNRNGVIYQQEPDPQFYQLENNYFQNNKLCP